MRRIRTQRKARQSARWRYQLTHWEYIRKQIEK